MRAIPCTVPCQGFHFPTIRASHHHPYDVKSAISVPRLFCEEEFGQLWSMGTRTFQKACDVAFQSHELSGAPPPLERCQAPPAFAELAMRQLTALHSTVSSRVAMSQANACELKAALGHVVVSSSQTTGNMTVLMITIDGGTLSYDVSGAGPPIVFVAGLGERGTYRMAQVAAFSSAFQVVTFDHRGVGASEGQPPYKVEQWAADTLRLIDHLGLDRVHLVGHSTGGTIAQVLAADHSDRVASLVLDATWARLDARLCKLFVFRKQALYEQVRFDRRSASWHTPQEIAAARIDALLTYDAGERLRNIRNPTLLVSIEEGAMW